jgi:hypothetical protein
MAIRLMPISHSMGPKTTKNKHNAVDPPQTLFFQRFSNNASAVRRTLKRREKIALKFQGSSKRRVVGRKACSLWPCHARMRVPRGAHSQDPCLQHRLTGFLLSFWRAPLQSLRPCVQGLWGGHYASSAQTSRAASYKG